jgi:hypothetical protein
VTRNLVALQRVVDAERQAGYQLAGERMLRPMASARRKFGGTAILRRNRENAMNKPDKPSIVFAHGLWADGSCFQKVAARSETADQ